jgi:hypothetical protein
MACSLVAAQTIPHGRLVRRREGGRREFNQSEKQMVLFINLECK